jgi:hypothetical protein
MVASKNHNIPHGVAHLELLDAGAGYALDKSRSVLEEKEGNQEFIGVCMNVLYQAATCTRKCHGGGHVLESICGRAYNLAAAALHLSKLGYYDEALNLIRGIGEIYNLVALSAFEQNSMQEWLQADEKTRRNKFSPASVRKRLAKFDADAMIAYGDWYSDLCEKYTHVTPKTRPNFHNDKQPMCGGHFQSEGLDEVLGQLVMVLGALSMFICRYFKFDDLFQEISDMLKGGEEGSNLGKS